MSNYYQRSAGRSNYGNGDFTDISASSSTIAAAELASNSVTNPKLADNAVDTDEITASAVSEVKLNGALITGTSNASAGTISTHAHGLSATPSVVYLTPVETSDGTAGAVALAGFGSTGKDSTNVYVKSDEVSQDFEAYALL